MSGEFDDDIRASMAAAKKQPPLPPKRPSQSTAPRTITEDDIGTLTGESLRKLMEALKAKPDKMRDEYVGKPFQFDPSEDYGRKDPGLEEMMNVLRSQNNVFDYSHMQDI